MNQYIQLHEKQTFDIGYHTFSHARVTDLNYSFIFFCEPTNFYFTYEPERQIWNQQEISTDIIHVFSNKKNCLLQNQNMFIHSAYHDLFVARTNKRIHVYNCLNERILTIKDVQPSDGLSTDFYRNRFLVRHENNIYIFDPTKMCLISRIIIEPQHPSQFRFFDENFIYKDFSGEMIDIRTKTSIFRPKINTEFLVFEDDQFRIVKNLARIDKYYLLKLCTFDDQFVVTLKGNRIYILSY